MSEARVTVDADGLLAVEQHKGPSSEALNDVLSTFAEPVHTTTSHSHYRITAASIWRARRQGLSLQDILDALETHCDHDVPESLIADVALWSEQIDRLWLETDQGRLILQSNNQLLISAMLRQPKLRRFIKQKIDTNRLELQVETDPDWMRAFDEAQYPMLDRRREQPAATSSHAARSNPHPTGQRPKRKKGSTKRRSPKVEVSARTPIPTDDLFDTFRRQRTHRCRATTRTGRPCKNRVRPPDMYCRIHTELAALEPEYIQDSVRQDPFQQLIDMKGITVEQMALFRVGINVTVGLGTWLLSMFFMWIGASWLGLSLASWYTIPLAFLLTCWLVSKLVFKVQLRWILLLICILSLSILMDFFNKEGLILNICFVLIPFVLPLYLLYQYNLSGWWSLLFLPVGFIAGWVFYHILEDAPE